MKCIDIFFGWVFVRTKDFLIGLRWKRRTRFLFFNSCRMRRVTHVFHFLLTRICWIANNQTHTLIRTLQSIQTDRECFFLLTKSFIVYLRSHWWICESKASDHVYAVKMTETFNLSKITCISALSVFDEKSFWRTITQSINNFDGSHNNCHMPCHRIDCIRLNLFQLYLFVWFQVHFDWLKFNGFRWVWTIDVWLRLRSRPHRANARSLRNLWCSLRYCYRSSQSIGIKIFEDLQFW